MAFLDYSTPIGALMMMMDNMTGSSFLSILFLMIILMFMFIGLRLPIELVILIVLPLLLGVVLITGQIWLLVGIVIIYLSIVFAKNWFIQ